MNEATTLGLDNAKGLGKGFFEGSGSRIICYLHDKQRGDILTDMV